MIFPHISNNILLSKIQLTWLSLFCPCRCKFALTVMSWNEKKIIIIAIRTRKQDVHVVEWKDTVL